MLASPVSSSAGKPGSLVLRLLVVLVVLVLIDLMLTIYLFGFSDGSGRLGGGLSKGKTPTVSTVIEVHKQIKSDVFTPYVAVESSPAAMVKESVDIWLIFITSEGASAQPLSGDGKAKGEPFSLPACDNGLAQPYEVFGGQIVCKGALGEKDNLASAAKNGECAGEVIYRDSQVTVCATPSAKQVQTVGYLQKGKTIWKTSLQDKPALAANSKSIWATRITDKQGKISYQRFDVPGTPDPGSEKPAGWDAIKKVDFNNIDITNGDGYIDFAQVLYLQTVGGEIPERDEGERTFQGRVHQILVWIWDPQSQKPKLMEPKLIPPSNGPFCDGEASGGNLFAADVSAAEGLGLKVKYLYSETGWFDAVGGDKNMEQLTQASRSEEADYRVIKDNLVRVVEGTATAVVPPEACIEIMEEGDEVNNVPDVLPFRGADASLAVSPKKFKNVTYWFPVWKDPQGNILSYAVDDSHDNYVLGWSK